MRIAKKLNRNKYEKYGILSRAGYYIQLFYDLKQFCYFPFDRYIAFFYIFFFFAVHAAIVDIQHEKC